MALNEHQTERLLDTLDGIKDDLSKQSHSLGVMAEALARMAWYQSEILDMAREQAGLAVKPRPWDPAPTVEQVDAAEPSPATPEPAEGSDGEGAEEPDGADPARGTAAETPP